MARKNRAYEDRSFSIGTQGRIRTETLVSGSVLHLGTVATVWGYVVVDTVYLTNGMRYTNLDLIYDGEVYLRHFDEYFRPRTLVRLANQFAADIAGGQEVT